MTVHDDRILVYLAQLVSCTTPSGFDDVLVVFSTYGTLLGQTSLQFRLSHLCGVLLTYSPASVSMSQLVRLIENVEKHTGVANDREETSDIEEFAYWISSKVKETYEDDEVSQAAREIEQHMQTQSAKFGFSVEERPYLDLLDAFIRAKLFASSIYVDSVAVPVDVLAMMKHHRPFSEWYKGLFQVYKYYYDNYAAINDKSQTKYHQICNLVPAETFQILIAPLDLDAYSDKLHAPQWMKNVILPYLAYVGDFTPLSEWLFGSNSLNPVEKYQQFNDVIHSLIESEVPFDSYADIAHKFIASCYFDAFTESGWSSIETLKVYDIIKQCCVSLVAVVPVGTAASEDSIKFAHHQYETLNDFMQPINTLSPLFALSKDSVISLTEIIDICIKLYSFNKMTIAEFIELKYSASDVDTKKRKVSQILVGLNATNSGQIFTSINLFTDTFLAQDELNAVNKLVLSRLLACDLFDEAKKLLDEQKLGVTMREFHDLLLSKFWECLNEASSFDDRTGKLHNASLCLKLLGSIPTDASLDQAAKKDIIGLGHVMKVFPNIKNFKITIDNKRPTPSIILQRYSTLPLTEELRTDKEQSSPMGLITTILEQNPKSYLAFEKLFKILNDFLLFLNDDDYRDTYYFERLSSACIEAALIDNNFSYAYKKALDLIEHFSRSDNMLQLNYMWLTFYQIGRYMSPDWYNDDGLQSAERFEVIQKQSDILSKYLMAIRRSESSIDNFDNSRLIAEQWSVVNHSIDEFYDRMEKENEDSAQHHTISQQLQENITATANEIFTDAAQTTTQASEKLSNLLVSGLGWAIGASTRRS